MVLIGVDTKTVRRKEQEVYTFRADGYDNIILYAVKRYVNVVTEGNKEHFFEARDETNTPESVQQAGEDVEEEVALPKRSHVLEEEIQAFKSAGVEIDDDNEPAPENVPVPTAPTLTEDTVMKEWGFSGFCYRRRDGNRQSPATINRSRDAWSTMRRIDYFLLFFPVDYVKDKMLAEMNKKIRKGRPQITWWEYLRWLGIWELLATTEGHSRSAFWRKDVTCDYAPDHRFEGAPFRLFDLMSYNRFTEILEVHTLYDEPLRTDFVDRFAHVRHFIAAWNDNVEKQFNPAWVVCLDESMSLWTNMFTCPGFIFCPRKPWETGNEYHTIACGETGIIFGAELVEGKDRPKEFGSHRYDYIGGKTVGLLLRLTHSIWNSGRVVVLDSGFCVLKGIIELRKKGLYAGALIKKRRYWPKYIKGDEIKKHFDNKPIGTADAWKGELEGVPFHVFAMKEPDYVMSIMATYGTLNEMDDGETKRHYVDENGDAQSTTFKYTELFYNHYKYRHVVDNNNNNRMQPIALEKTWKTSWWPDRCFAFFLGVTTVNAQRGFERIGGNESDEVLQF